MAAAQEADTIKFLEGEGVVISKLEDLDTMKEKTKPVVESWVSKAPLIAKITSALQGE